jgi:Cu/Ag efflux pump CusA
MSRWIVALLLPLSFMAGCSGSSEIAGDEPAVVEEVAGHEMEHPLAVVILGGLFTSTLLNLFVVPALYLRFGRPATKPSGAG